MPDSSNILADYVSLADFAAQLNVTLRTAERYVSRAVPGLPVTKIGRQVLVHREDGRQWLLAHRVQRNVARGRR
jgi:hypothetical protein